MILASNYTTKVIHKKKQRLIISVCNPCKVITNCLEKILKPDLEVCDIESWKETLKRSSHPVATFTKLSARMMGPTGGTHCVT